MWRTQYSDRVLEGTEPANQYVETFLYSILKFFMSVYALLVLIRLVANRSVSTFQQSEYGKSQLVIISLFLLNARSTIVV
jgi:hypothetical protein